MAEPTHFEKKRDEIAERIKVAEELKQINDKLNRFNWMFIHPEIFMSEFNRLVKLADNPHATQEMVTKVFADLFYDFRITALTVDGNLKPNPYIGDFEVKRGYETS